MPFPAQARLLPLHSRIHSPSPPHAHRLPPPLTPIVLRIPNTFLSACTPSRAVFPAAHCARHDAGVPPVSRVRGRCALVNMTPSKMAACETPTTRRAYLSSFPRCAPLDEYCGMRGTSIPFLISMSRLYPPHSLPVLLTSPLVCSFALPPHTPDPYPSPSHPTPSPCARPRWSYSRLPPSSLSDPDPHPRARLISSHSTRSSRSSLSPPRSPDRCIRVYTRLDPSPHSSPPSLLLPPSPPHPTDLSPQYGLPKLRSPRPGDARSGGRALECAAPSAPAPAGWLYSCPCLGPVVFDGPTLVLLFRS
ncbi:hypothetical protein C8J57DRAFT_1598514 [Mycena rebaudengoi]|nr:hypothetical protein C8J57DRAFT_1598514 [Mycena rebaudengoi]